MAERLKSKIKKVFDFRFLQQKIPLSCDGFRVACEAKTAQASRGAGRLQFVGLKRKCGTHFIVLTKKRTLNNLSKYLIQICLSMLSVCAFAGQQMTNIFLFDVTPSELCKITYDDSLGYSLVMTDEVLKSELRLNISIKNKTNKELENIITPLLKGNGFDIKKEDGVIFVSGKKAAPKIPFVYKPKHRSATYLVERMRELFPQDFGGATTQTQTHQSMPTINPLATNAPSIAQKDQTTTYGESSAYARSISRDADVIAATVSEHNTRGISQKLEELDIPAKTARIRAAIVEVTDSDTEQSAIAAVGRIFSALGGSLQVTAKIGQAVTGGVTISYEQMTTALNILNNKTSYALISNPEIVLENGEQGRFVSGSENPVLGSILTLANGQQSQSITYRQSGVELLVKPQINEGGITAEFTVRLSEFAQNQTSGINSPTLYKREITTKAFIPNSSIIVVGGMTTSKNTSESNAPFFANWLKSTGATATKGQIVLVLFAETLN